MAIGGPCELCCWQCFVEAEDSFGQLSLKGLQLGQQPIVKDPRLGPIEEAWQDAVFNYLHGGERVELSMPEIRHCLSQKNSSPSFFNAVD